MSGQEAILHYIDDDTSGDWLEQWAEDGLLQIEDTLGRYWAFGDFLIEHGIDKLGTATELPDYSTPRRIGPIATEKAIGITLAPSVDSETLLTQVER